jgi:hypothetical protein
MPDHYEDPRRIRATFDRLVAGLPDEATLWASGALDDTVLDILQTHSHPLPPYLLPRHVIAPAVIMGALCIEDRDPIDRNRLLHAIRRHSDLYAGIVSVEDYPGRTAFELGIDALYQDTEVLAIIWLDTGPVPGWLAAQLSGPQVNPPRIYGRRLDDTWDTVAEDVAEFLRHAGWP